ncbi:MAG: putative Glycosyltransferase [Sphingomonadales bacterium]|nr:putative Glycosyltransferase [Sphingomonadales bacterium]
MKRSGPALLAAIVAIAIALRFVAMLILKQPLQSDALSYFTMAKGLASNGELLDNFGQHVFYSAGYPLFLAPFFVVLGAGVPVALAINLLLAGISVWLIYRLALTLSSDPQAGLLGALVFALWFPGIWNATVLAKENLSTPLLLALTLSAVGVARGGTLVAIVAGLLWGVALITGGSALLLCTGVGVALILLWRREGRFRPAFRSGLCFLLGALLTLGPWLYATDRMVGRPVLTTNAAFNLYIGNNPAATGRFVSIADTPLGKDWNATRLQLGEVANSNRLQSAALQWVSENPARAGGLALLKLGYFWEPNVPDTADFATSRAIASIRLIEVAEYLVILVAGFTAFRSRLIARDDKWILAAMIAGFWLIHATAYIIARYRDPVIPLLIVMGSIPVAAWLRKVVSHAR